MAVISISLADRQLETVNKMSKTYGFINRSEFFRSLLRVAFAEPGIVMKASTFPFVFPKEKSIKKIVSAFSKTKKYSHRFLKDLEEGLKNSDYFVK